MELGREHVRHDPKRLLADGAGDLPATRFGDEDGARLVSDLLVAGRDLGGEDGARGVQAGSGDPEIAGDLRVPEHFQSGLAGIPASFVGRSETA
jgi:hypothetical protein